MSAFQENFHRPMDIENMHPSLCIPYGICDGDDQQKLALLSPSSPPSSTTNINFLHSNQMSLFGDDLDHVGHLDLHSPVDGFGLDYDEHYDVSFNSDDIIWSQSNGIFNSFRRPLKMNTVFQVVDSADIKSGPTLAQLNLNHSDDNDLWEIDLLSYHHHHHHSHHHHQQPLHLNQNRIIGMHTTRKSFEGHHPFCSSYSSLLKPCSSGLHANHAMKIHSSAPPQTFNLRSSPSHRSQCCQLGHNTPQQPNQSSAPQSTVFSQPSPTTSTCRLSTPAIVTSTPVSSNNNAHFHEKGSNPRLKEDIDYLTTLICGNKANQSSHKATNDGPVSSLAKSCSTLAQSLSTGPKLLDCNYNTDRKPISIITNEHITTTSTNQTPSSSSPQLGPSQKNQSNAISSTFTLFDLARRNAPSPMNDGHVIKLDLNDTQLTEKFKLEQQSKTANNSDTNVNTNSMEQKMKCTSTFDGITSTHPYATMSSSMMKPQEQQLIQTTTVINEQKSTHTMLSSLLNSGSLASRNLSHCNNCQILTDITAPQTTLTTSHLNGSLSSQNHPCQQHNIQTQNSTNITTTSNNNNNNNNTFMTTLPDNCSHTTYNTNPNNNNQDTGSQHQSGVIINNIRVTTPITTTQPQSQPQSQQQPQTLSQSQSSHISSTTISSNRPTQAIGISSTKGINNFFTQPASPSASSTTSSLNDSNNGPNCVVLSTNQTTVPHKGGKNQNQRFRHNSMSTDCSMSSHDEGFASQMDADDNMSDSDDDGMSSDDESFYGDYSNNDLIGASISDDAENKWTLNMGRSRRNGQKRYFWQYNVQSKGPKGTRISSLGDTQDPHVLPEASDPVFSNDCQVEGVKHSGKARRGDGNDLTPNPRKLLMIGLELKKLGKIINELAPVTDVPINARYKTRKEKNKLASRACRLKKKAQHEANKIKLYGLQHEHRQIVSSIKEIRKLLREALADSNHKKNNVHLTLYSTIKAFSDKCSMKVAGQTSDYVNGVLDKVVSGIIDGGLNQI